MKTRNDWEKLDEMLDGPFHVVLDNDMFFVYPTCYPDPQDMPDDRRWEEWQESGVAFDANPKQLLTYLIEALGGTSENV